MGGITIPVPVPGLGGDAVDDHDDHGGDDEFAPRGATEAGDSHDDDPPLDDDHSDDHGDDHDPEATTDTDIDHEPPAVAEPDDFEQAFDAGRRAREEGQSFDDTAYASGSRLRIRWERGWAYQDGRMAAQSDEPREFPGRPQAGTKGGSGPSPEIPAAWFNGYDDAVSDARLADQTPDSVDAANAADGLPVDAAPVLAGELAAEAPAAVTEPIAAAAVTAEPPRPIGPPATITTKRQEILDRLRARKSRLGEIALELADVDVERKSLRDQYKGCLEEVQSARRELAELDVTEARPLPLFDGQALRVATSPPAEPVAASVVSVPPPTAPPAPPAPPSSAASGAVSLAEWRALPIADALGGCKGITEKRLEKLAELDPPVTTAGQLCDLIARGDLQQVKGFGEVTVTAISDAIVERQPRT